MNLRHIGFSLAVALWVSAFGASAAHAQAYLKIDGVLGEATDAVHKDEIVVGAYSYGAQAAVGSGGAAGTSVGKASFDALSFTHKLDRASATLMLALAKGRHFKTAVLTVRKSSTPSEFLKVTLTDVLVSSVKTSGDGQEAQESVTLVYTRIEVEYFVTQRDGKLVPGSKMSWDLTKNTGG